MGSGCGVRSCVWCKRTTLGLRAFPFNRWFYKELILKTLLRFPVGTILHSSLFWRYSCTKIQGNPRCGIISTSASLKPIFFAIQYGYLGSQQQNWHWLEKINSDIQEKFSINLLQFILKYTWPVFLKGKSDVWGLFYACTCLPQKNIPVFEQLVHHRYYPRPTDWGPSRPDTSSVSCSGPIGAKRRKLNQLEWRIL